MIDTNQINQVFDNADDLKQHVGTNWPAICAGALWLRTEIKNVSEYIIGHGGILMIAKKMIWNPVPAAPAIAGAPTTASAHEDTLTRLNAELENEAADTRAKLAAADQQLEGKKES